MITVHREFDGVRIEGNQYAVWIHPLSDWREPGDATLSIGVDAISPRWEGWARLTSDVPHEFAAGDVELLETVAGDELRCLCAPHADTPAYRPGFVVTLEPGMRAFLETELPRVERVTHLAAALRTAVEPHLGRTLPEYGWTTLLPHERSALVAIAARDVLNGYPPADAMKYAVMLHDGRWGFSDEGDDPQYAELGAALRQPDVTALLTSAAAPTAADAR
ncbi:MULTISPECIES: hypothetical protein [Paraburkholderia]|uniref:Uncharacterized protein n=1 Tax=Paraburkholderia madseniana TaxID=2599607 RepID=A0AAP5BHW0_9BURK|nr:MULTISPECIES: hypothetical protein [Paraburkholderia]MCX4150038.1 hypothetical protein [Paraburkholderia madseniana]MCX4175671.1 hypothetical protein [Paraburkholderia madseniana]MDN7152974.1 hypothetical protein [Paraburkholderia sp. WS6]MDQ6411856.1 hypothetical protein [Paraburkholderia madseniana]MDQ6463666.1 hypothetical protein [Paraburkholderia madseniana]